MLSRLRTPPRVVIHSQPPPTSPHTMPVGHSGKSTYVGDKDPRTHAISTSPETVIVHRCGGSRELPYALSEWWPYLSREGHRSLS